MAKRILCAPLPRNDIHTQAWTLLFHVRGVLFPLPSIVDTDIDVAKGAKEKSDVRRNGVAPVFRWNVGHTSFLVLLQSLSRHYMCLSQGLAGNPQRHSSFSLPSATGREILLRPSGRTIGLRARGGICYGLRPIPEILMDVSISVRATWPHRDQKDDELCCPSAARLDRGDDGSSKAHFVHAGGCYVG